MAVNDIRYYIDAIKSAHDGRDICNALDYLLACSGVVVENYEPPHDVIPIENFKTFEKLPEMIEILWYKLTQPSEFVQKSKTFMKVLVEKAVNNINSDEFSSEYVRLLISIFTPKPYQRGEYRYNQDSQNDQPSKIASKLMEYFSSKLNGIEIIREKIKTCKCSFDTLKKLLHTLKKYYKLYESNEREEEVEEFVNIVFQKILDTTDEEFKNESKKDLDMVIKYLEGIVTNMTDHQNCGTVFTDIIQTYQMSVSLKCFKSLSLEKRNAGLNDIIRHTKTHDNYMSFRQPVLAPEKLVVWIKENKIVELLYGETMHIQLLQKCTDILRFLAERKAFERKYLDIMWNAADGKHETIENVIYETIGNIAPFLPIADVDYLYQLINNIPISHYTNQTLQLISCLTQHNRYQSNSSHNQNNNNNNNYYNQNNINSIDDVVPSNSSSPTQPSSTSTSPSLAATTTTTSPSQPTTTASNLTPQQLVPLKGLEIFWNLIQDDSEASIELSHHALNYLVDSLLYHQPQRTEYLQKCIENIDKHTTVLNSLRIIQNIINNQIERAKMSSVNRYQSSGGSSGTIVMMNNNYPSQNNNNNGNGNGQSIFNDPAIAITRNVNQQFGLMNIFFSHLLYYKNQCEKVVSKSMVPVDGNEPICCGKQGHFDVVNEFLMFLSFIYDRSQTQPTIEQFDILWQVFVVKPITNQDRDMFFKWFDRFNLNDNSILPHLLDKFGEISFVDIEPSGAQLCINCVKFGNSNNLDRVATDDIIGIDTLWRLSLESHNEDVGKESISFLIDFYKYKRQVTSKEEFLSICMNKLSQIPSRVNGQEYNQSTTITIMRILSLIKTYIEGFGSKVTDSFRKTFAPAIIVTFTNQKMRIPMTVRSSDKVFVVKQQLAHHTNSNPACLTFFHNTRVLHDWDTFDDYRVNNHDQILVNETSEPRPQLPNENQFPLDFDQSQFGLLFSLLSIDNLAPTVWEVLMLLPVNRNVYDTLVSIGVQQQETSSSQQSQQQPTQNVKWEQILDHTSVYKLLYSLLIIDNIANLESQWRQRFIELGGLTELIKILMTVDLQHESKGNKRKKCLSLLLNTITTMLIDQQTETLKLQLVGVSPTLFLTRLMDLAFLQAKGTVKEEEQLNIHHFLTDDGEVIGNLFHMIITLLIQPQQLEEFCNRPNVNQWIALLLIETSDPSVRDSVVSRLIQFCNNNVRAHDFFLDQCLQLIEITVGNDKYSTNSSHFYNLLSGLIASTCAGFGLPGYNPNTPSQPMISPRALTANVNRFQPLLEKLVLWVKVHPVVETQANIYQPDYVIIGLLQLIHVLVRANYHFKYLVGHQMQLVEEIFHRCLFDIPTADNHGQLCPPKCKSKESRDVCFVLLIELAKDCKENYNTLLKLLIDQNKEDEKRVLWNYLPTGNEKSQCGYVGLKNLGATCYINSLLQQFFMIPGFRYSILQSEDKVGNPSESILYQIKSIFGYLQESEKRSHDPKDFCSTYKYDGQPINVYVQMDVDEFFNMLFDKLENQLKGTPQEKLLNEFFGGSTVNQFISQECPHVSEREESFYTISVEVKNKKDILESLQLFVESETLDGDNKYFCSQCSQKVKCLMRRCVKQLPNTLIVHNKRFEFDLDFMRRTKINDQLRFPMTLDMSPYTKENLERKEALEKVKRMEDQIKELETNQEEPEKIKELIQEKDKIANNLPVIHPASYYEYELSGILVHSGTADSGHYYSFIKEREPLIPGQPRRWIQFNDQLTEIFNVEDIPKACFGGYDQPGEKSNMIRSTPRFNNAYMLFYERVVKVQTSPKLQLYQNITPSHQSKLVPQEIFNTVWNKNMKFLHDKNIYDQNYFQFIWNTLALVGPLPPSQLDSQSQEYRDYEEQIMLSVELGTRFLLDTISHARERKQLGDFVNHLGNIFERNALACKWFIKALTNEPAWIKSNILSCINSEPREQLIKLINIAIKTLLPYDRQYYFQDKKYKSSRKHQQMEDEDSPMEIDNGVGGMVGSKLKRNQNSIEQKPLMRDTDDDDQDDDDTIDEDDDVVTTPKSIIVRFMDVYLGFIKDAPSYWKHFTQYFQLIKDFSSMGREEREYLINRGVISSLIDFYMGDESPIAKTHPQQKKIKMGDKTGSPILTAMLDTIAILAHSCHTNYTQTTGEVIPSMTETEPLKMSDEDYYMLTLPNFILKTLREGISTRATVDIILHTSYGDRDQSLAHIETLENCENKTSLEVLFHLVELEDNCQEDRIDAAIQAYINLIDSSNKQRSLAPYIKHIIDLGLNKPMVGDWFRKNLDQWLFVWLVQNDMLDVRAEAFNLICHLFDMTHIDLSLSGEQLDKVNHSRLLQLTQQQQQQQDKQQEDLQDSVNPYIDAMFNYLVNLIPAVKTYLKKEKESRFGKFEYYIRLLNMCVSSHEAYKQLFVTHSKKILKLLSVFISTQTEIEKNRQEMIHLVATFLTNNPTNVQILCNHPIRDRLMEYYISISPREDLKNFNHKSLPFFYQVIYYLIQESPEYLSQVAQHNNFTWALHYLYLECGEYTDVAYWLYRITEYVVLKTPQYVNKLISSCLGFHNLHLYPPHSSQILTLLTCRRRDMPYYFMSHKHPKTGEPWVPYDQLFKTIKAKPNTSLDNAVTIRYIELVQKILTFIRKDVQPSPQPSPTQPSPQQKDVIVIDGDSDQQQQPQQPSPQPPQLPKRVNDDTLQLSFNFWDPQNQFLKNTIQVLFTTAETYPVLIPNIAKVFNLVACESADGMIGALSEVFNKRNFEQPTTTHHSEQFYKFIWDVIMLVSKDVSVLSPQYQHKSVIIQLKLAKEMILYGLKDGYQVVESLKTSPMFKDDEKASLLTMVFKYPNILSESDTFMATMKQFYLDCEKLLSNESNQLLTSFLRTMEDQVQTSIASFNSLGGFKLNNNSNNDISMTDSSNSTNQQENNNNNNKEIEQHLMDLTNYLKSCEILSSNGLASNFASQLISMIQSVPSEFPEQVQSPNAKKLKSALEKFVKK